MQVFLSNFIPNKKNIFKRMSIICLISIFIISVTGCKSSKKAQKSTEPIPEIIVPQKKKEKDDTIEAIKNRGVKIAAEALTWKGTPYGFGKSDKGKATDCSGLVIVVFQEIAEIKLPRNSSQQADFCEELKEKDVMAGDLVFFATGKDKNQISHVGVMIDKKNFVHASASKGVIISDMDTPYYIRTFKKYGRVPLKSLP